MKKYYKYILLFGWICSIALFLINYNLLSLTVGFILLILNFLFLKDKTHIIIGTIFSLCCIFINCFSIYKNYRDSIDFLKDKNILLGSWLYNDIGGSFVFNEDYSYYQYISSNTLDNYCFGKYNYEYGGIDDDKNIIYKDDFYYYYTIDIDIDYCVINGNADKNIEDSSFVFSVNIDDYNDIIFMDIDKNNTFKINKLN